MTFIGQKFHRGEKPPSAGEIAEALAVSSRLISQIIQLLLQSKLLVEVATPEAAYCPARPLESITYEDILHTLRVGKGQEPATRAEPARELVRGELDVIEEAERKMTKALTVRAMVERAEALAAEQAPA